MESFIKGLKHVMTVMMTIPINVHSAANNPLVAIASSKRERFAMMATPIPTTRVLIIAPSLAVEMV